MRYTRLLLLSLFFIFIGADIAQAAEVHPTNWPDLGWRVVNLALVIAAIWFLASKKIAAFFAGRKTGIATELADLETRKEKARDELAAVEKRIANLEQERNAILAEYRARGEAVKAEIIAKAEEAAAQITSQAKKSAQNEVDQAVAAMRAELADELAKAASEALAASLTTKDHEKLIDASITKVVLQ